MANRVRNTSDLDIYRSANVLVDRHGAEAPIEAAMHAGAMLDKGDLDGQRAALLILGAARVLSARDPGNGPLN